MKFFLISIFLIFNFFEIFESLKFRPNNNKTISHDHQQECDALLVFFLALDGPNWRRKQNWQEEADCCTWQGINCEPSMNRVNQIQLSNNNLRGSLPRDFIKELDFLHTIVLAQNQISGELPDMPSTSLENFHVSHNWLGGELSADWIKSLPTLKSMSVEANRISGGLPYGYLSQLHTLDIANNSFTGELPRDFGFYLIDLRADNNKFSGSLPTEIEQSPRINRLDLHNNQFTGPLPNLEFNRDLQYFDVSINKFEGEFPSAFGDMDRLGVLKAQRNQFTFFLTNTRRPMELRVCDLAVNKFVCPIPGWAKDQCFASCK